MKPDVEFAVWASDRQQRVAVALGGALDAAVPAIGGADAATLVEAMRYATLGGGKRVRALLAYAAGELAGAQPADVDPVACAVELVHAYSLVHDDLPCMDDDDMRRGRPSCHVAFGEATALLAGDALQALAFTTLAASPVAPAAAVGILADACGARGMVAGQAVDLAATGRTLQRDELEAMHRLKTGALIRAAVVLGARAGAADADTLAGLERYASATGLAFQVVDDILDAEGTTQTLGKTAGKDAARGKPTYVTTLGGEAAREHAARLRADAHAALATFGARARRLGEIADWITLRRH
jgi:farnesyl diphosphate synthase